MEKAGKKILLYVSPEAGPLEERLRRCIAIHRFREDIESYPSPAALCDRLVNPLAPKGIVVLFVSGRAELVELGTMADVLVEERLILVLPDDNAGTVALAHALRPRFITYGDSDFLDLSAVLGKMLNRQNIPESRLMCRRGTAAPDRQDGEITGE